MPVFESLEYDIEGGCRRMLIGAVIDGIIHPIRN